MMLHLCRSLRHRLSLPRHRLLRPPMLRFPLPRQRQRCLPPRQPMVLQRLPALLCMCLTRLSSSSRPLLIALRLQPRLLRLLLLVSSPSRPLFIALRLQPRLLRLLLLVMAEGFRSILNQKNSYGCKQESQDLI
jgi:hypothetical protein